MASVMSLLMLAGGIERVGILLEQHEIGVGIHQDGVLRLGLERAAERSARRARIP